MAIPFPNHSYSIKVIEKAIRVNFTTCDQGKVGIIQITNPETGDKENIEYREGHYVSPKVVDVNIDMRNLRFLEEGESAHILNGVEGRKELFGDLVPEWIREARKTPKDWESFPDNLKELSLEAAATPSQSIEIEGKYGPISLWVTDDISLQTVDRNGISRGVYIQYLNDAEGLPPLIKACQERRWDAWLGGAIGYYNDKAKRGSVAGHID